MRVFIATDVRLTRSGGRLYIVGQVATIFQRYYDNFGKLVVCSRERDSDQIGKMVDVTELIDETVTAQSLSAAYTADFRRKMRSEIEKSDLVIGRFHSVFANVAAECAKKLGKPFFAELMGDAWDAYWNHGISGKLAAPYMFLKTRRIVKDADYAVYVTKEFLQKRYPCRNESVGVSDVCIKSIEPGTREKRLEKIEQLPAGQVTLMTTAAVDVRYKGQEYVIRAIPKLNRAGLRVKYVLIGGGSPDYLRGVAEECGVADQVEFAGQLALDEVFQRLELADIYLQPSLQEGLPRSVAEAMSRGCPVVGARTAGIPELIDPSCVVRRKNVKDIENAILAIVTDKERMARLAMQNLTKAEEYLDEVLSAQRNGYYDKIKRELNG